MVFGWLRISLDFGSMCRLFWMDFFLNVLAKTLDVRFLDVDGF